MGFYKVEIVKKKESDSVKDKMEIVEKKRVTAKDRKSVV